MVVVSSVPRNVKKVVSDTVERTRQRQCRIRKDKRFDLLGASRREANIHRLEQLLCCGVAQQSSSTLSTSEETLTSRVAAATRSMNGVHSTTPSDLCGELDMLQHELRSIGGGWIPNHVMIGVDELIKGGVFDVMDRLLGHSPEAAHIALELEEVLHQVAPPFSVLPHKARRFDVIAEFLNLLLSRSQPFDGMWVGVPANATAAASRDDLLCSACRVIRTLLDDSGRCCEASSKPSFFHLLSALYSWRPVSSACLIATLCRQKESSALLYQNHSTALMEAVTGFVSQGQRLPTLSCSLRPDRCVDDVVDVVYYGYACLNALLPYAWESIQKVVLVQLPHLAALAEASRRDTGLMEEVLVLLKEFGGVLQGEGHAVLPFLQDLFRNRAGLRDSIVSVLASAPCLFVADTRFLCEDVFPHYRGRAVSRVQLLSALTTVCLEQRDKILMLVEDEDAAGWLTVIADDELSPPEQEKLETLLECLGLGGNDFWADGERCDEGRTDADEPLQYISF